MPPVSGPASSIVTEQAQVISGGQPGRTGADHQHMLAGRRRGLYFPAAPQRLVAEKAFDHMNIYGVIELSAIAG
jgi:hypothetical protein